MRMQTASVLIFKYLIPPQLLGKQMEILPFSNWKVTHYYNEELTNFKFLKRIFQFKKN